MASGPITSCQIDGETMETGLIFLGSKITADGDCSHEIKRCLPLGRRVMTNPDSILKKQRHHFADKCSSSQIYGFSSNHVWMWELDHKNQVPKNWCFQVVVLEKTPESPLDCKEIKPVHPKGNQHWIFIGRNDTEPEASILQPPDIKSRLIRKDPDPGKVWGQEKTWDGWMASLTWWAWVWVNSGSLWWTGRPGVLRFMGSQRVGHDWATELNIYSI